MDLLDKAKTFSAGKAGNIPMPEADVTDVDLKGISSECITYQAAISVKNPYGVFIPICEISYILKSAGRHADAERVYLFRRFVCLKILVCVSLILLWDYDLKCCRFSTPRFLWDYSVL